MRETRADTALSVMLAIGLHVVLLALMFAGLWWTRATTPVSAAGSPVEAELVDPNALSASMRRALSTPAKPLPPEPAEETSPPPQPLAEPSPQDSPVPQQSRAQEQVPVPAPIEQERVDREAISAETREREQEEKRRQEQIDLTERERQEEIEKRQRLAQMQAERAKQIADIRKQRAEAAKEINRAEQKLKQLADIQARNAAEAAARSDAAASAPPGNNGVDASLLAQYQAAIQAAIQSQWVKPDNVPEGATCRLTIRQLPGGEVAAGGVSIGSPCQFDEVARDSVERAVLKAAPLPYAGFESVFNRTLNLNFEAQSR
jgi:colicin import membrane protein